MSFGNIFEFTSEQIAVLFEEIDVPVACACHNHRHTVFLCEFFCFFQKIRPQAYFYLITGLEASSKIIFSFPQIVK